VAAIVASTSRDADPIPQTEALPTGIYVNGEELEHSDFHALDTRPSPRGLRVLLINDIPRPWSAEAAHAVTMLVRGLSEAGADVLGEVPNPTTGDHSEVEDAARARLVLDGEQLPVDSRDAAGRFGQWFEKDGSKVDAVIWIAPHVGDPGAHPKVFVFTPGTLHDSDSAKALVAALEPAAQHSAD
jgi:hypothetical protein